MRPMTPRWLHGTAFALLPPAPVHVFHLGPWFDAAADAATAGCAANQTPFNGDHTTGILVLSTSGFPDDDGPIGRFGR